NGASANPSDAPPMKFANYEFAGMIEDEHALVTQELGVTRLRLLMGSSRGCMHAFMWGEAWPDAAQALMPLACLPAEIAGRNRMWRRMAIEAITADPAFKGGNYDAQPEQGLRTAMDLLILVGQTPLPQQLAMSTREATDAWFAAELPRRMAANDANDFIYAVAASRTYDPSRDL